jgi:lipopolysaccharide/colanic/teichoic acid biosynthesis glycosyltransferase
MESTDRRAKAPDTSVPLPDRTPREKVRRALNVFASAVGIVLAAPLMIVIAVLIKLTSPGPVLYTQVRVGLDRRGRSSTEPDGRCRRNGNTGGRPFRIYKFRTMTTEQPGSAQVWAAPDDPRVTPVGRVLRKFRLDELPQLFNVLKGDMNLVGPRPEQVEIFQELREKIEDYPVRQRVLPGITGWAQVNQGYDQCLEDVSGKLRYDLEYVRSRSPAVDLAIMLKTVPVVLLRNGSNPGRESTNGTNGENGTQKEEPTPRNRKKKRNSKSAG